ncbi:MAG: GIY-YIG nuclease family protein [Synechococcus sp. SB0678_bin_12]|nr:GIY-YIG nuclease family protein [Synechococcus sp. SB0678_bin_12]MYI88074.1 GIY-YIG nuclease family protein [Synechococcus sp. SB0672_bin_10]
MDVTGIPLTPQLIQRYLLELMEPGKAYKREQLVDLVRERHLEAKGSLAKASLTGQVKKALQDLQRHGCVEQPVNVKGYWRIASGDLTEETIEHEDEPTNEPVKDKDEPIEEPIENEAEITIGDGVEKIYGWYYPSYRKLATLEGKTRFPVKVGRTTGKAEQRLRESCGMAPEKPVLGFVAHVDDSSTWERFVHSSLTLDGWKLPDAVGDEWFNSNLEELHEIVSLKLAEIERAKKARMTDSPPSNNEG